MRRSTLPFTPIKTYDPISVNLRKKQKKEKKTFLPLSFSSRSLSPAAFLLSFVFFIFSFFLLLLLLFWIYGSYYFIRIRLYSKIIFFLVHFILNKLSPSHFLTSKIFVKISSLKSLTTYHPENRKNISLVSEFDETFLSH